MDTKSAVRGLHAETAVERVYEQLKSMAIAFEFPPGGRVNELAVAKKIGVSRTPLREALNRLTADGFLTFSRQQGFFRKPLSVKTVTDLYELRDQLERGIVRLAAARASEAALDEVEAFVRSCRDAPGKTSQERLAQDERFHEMLAALSDNVEFMDTLRNLNERIRFLRWVDMETRGDDQQVEHLAIIEALRRREADRAESLVHGHVTLSPDKIERAVKDAFARIYMNREEPFFPPV
jgi:DNA-binding GntR family transcriptional regulator